MAGGWGILAYVSFGLIIAFTVFLVFIILILRSLLNSDYNTECAKDTTKNELNYSKNLTIGGIVFCTILILVFLTLGIVGIVKSVKAKDFSAVKEGAIQLLKP